MYSEGDSTKLIVEGAAFVFPENISMKLNLNKCLDFLPNLISFNNLHMYSLNIQEFPSLLIFMGGK